MRMRDVAERLRKDTDHPPDADGQQTCADRVGCHGRTGCRSVGAGCYVGVTARDRHQDGSDAGAIEQIDERGAGIHSDADAGAEQRSLGTAEPGQARQFAVASADTPPN